MNAVLAALFSTPLLVEAGAFEMSAKYSGRRRSYDEIHEICHGASSEVQGMFRQTLAILAGQGSNQEPLVEMASEVRDWCSTLPVTGAQRQCQGYVGLLIELTAFEDEHPASVMLVGAYGDLKEQTNACGLIVRTLNQALYDGHFTGLAVTKDLISSNGYGRTTSYEEVDTVVAASQSRVAEVVGSTAISTHTLGTAALTFGGAVSYILMRICHDYDTLSAIAPY